MAAAATAPSMRAPALGETHAVAQSSVDSYGTPAALTSAMRIQALLLLAALVFPACAVDDQEPVTDHESSAPQPDVPGEGKADGASDQLVAALTTKYGLRPHRFNGFFAGSDETEQRFIAALPRVTADLNARAKAVAPTVSFSAAELATNFITEGGYYLLNLDIHDSGEVVTLNGQTGPIKIDGYTFLGADTAADNQAALRPWLSSEMQALLADPSHRVTATNEKGEVVHTVFVDTIEQGLALNAAMFAWSRQLVARSAGAGYSGWPAEAKFFWTTVWYNGGPSTGATLLAQKGASWWKQPWTSPDDPALYSRYVRYNCLWRTSTWELMAKTVTIH